MFASFALLCTQVEWRLPRFTKPLPRCCATTLLLLLLQIVDNFYLAFKPDLTLLLLLLLLLPLLLLLQTVANFYLAFEQDLTLLPLLNKVDLPSADPPAVTAQMAATFDVSSGDVLAVSAKTGLGLQQLLPAVVE
jgi:hypothetical protein